jgi:hypothetical protein
VQEVKKIISYSLWGQNPKYLQGAIENARGCASFYPEFRCRFYVSVDVPRPIIWHLEELGAEIVEVESSNNWSGLFWRFRALEDADVCLVRDADSRLSQRERNCYDAWTQSELPIFTMHDHPAHIREFRMMPGLSGFRKGAAPSLVYDIELWTQLSKNITYGNDYYFFSHIWDTHLKGKVLIFDSIHPGVDDAVDFPTSRKGLEFVGKVFEHDNKTVPEHEAALQRWLDK